MPEPADTQPGSFQIDRIPERFQPALVRIHELSAIEGYRAAYVFGSVARGDTTAASDFDVHVLVGRQNPCASINHPVIDGVKLDLTFLSLEQLSHRTHQEIEKGQRVPMVAESLIVFDKTGELTHLRHVARQTSPTMCTPRACQAIQFGISHAHDKAQRYVDRDPPAALLVMHTSLDDVLNAHYQIQGRWRVSDKRLLTDLRIWDPILAVSLERFVIAVQAPAKFAIWSEIIEYVMAPLGGRQPMAENSCPCAVCQGDLALLNNR